MGCPSLGKVGSSSWINWLSSDTSFIRVKQKEVFRKLLQSLLVHFVKGFFFRYQVECGVFRSQILRIHVGVLYKAGHSGGKTGMRALF